MQLVDTTENEQANERAINIIKSFALQAGHGIMDTRYQRSSALRVFAKAKDTGRLRNSSVPVQPTNTPRFSFEPRRPRLAAWPLISRM